MWLRAPAGGHWIWWMAVTYDATKDSTDLSLHTPLLQVPTCKHTGTYDFWWSLTEIVTKLICTCRHLNWISEKTLLLSIFCLLWVFPYLHFFYQILHTKWYRRKISVLMVQGSSPELHYAALLNASSQWEIWVCAPTACLLVKAENLHNNCKYYFCVLACRQLWQMCSLHWRHSLLTAAGQKSVLLAQR